MILSRYYKSSTQPCQQIFDSILVDGSQTSKELLKHLIIQANIFYRYLQVYAQIRVKNSGIILNLKVSKSLQSIQHLETKSEIMKVHYLAINPRFPYTGL